MTSEHFDDEVGGVSGPQAAAREALAAEPIGHEGDAGPGDAPPAEQGPDQETWHELLRTAIGSLFAVAGSRWPKMAATEQEVEMLAKAWAPVAEKHMGTAIPIEYVAIGATLCIVGPKAIGAIADHKREQAQAARAAAPQRDQGTAYP